MQTESVYKLTVTENFVGDKRMLHTVFWWQHLGICVDINLVLLLCWWQYKIIDLRGFDTILRKGVTLVTALCCWLYHKYKPKLSPTKKKFAKSTIFENWHHWLFTDRKSADCPQIFDTQSIIFDPSVMFWMHFHVFSGIFMHFS